MNRLLQNLFDARNELGNLMLNNEGNFELHKSLGLAFDYIEKQIDENETHDLIEALRDAGGKFESIESHDYHWEKIEMFIAYQEKQGNFKIDKNGTVMLTNGNIRYYTNEFIMTFNLNGIN